MKQTTTTNNISTNFNSHTNLISRMTPEHLCIISVLNGLRHMCWDKLCGAMLSGCGTKGGAPDVITRWA